MRLFVSILLFPAAWMQLSAAPANPVLERQFTQVVQPYVKKYCTGCHGGQTPAAQFDLTSYTSLELVTKEYPRWHLLMERLTAKDMPPKPLPAPPATETAQVIHWVEAVKADEIRKYAGDPGLVPARRLSTAEYNYTIRDLTGHNLHLTKEFPIDPANPAGFDNSGESLTMSPALLNKYLQAARDVANHMVFLPDRFEFAGHPMLVETDREKFAVQRIMDFYRAQPTQLSAYFEAAWRFRHRAASGSKPATLAAAAAGGKLSRAYLEKVWKILYEPNALGPTAKLQKMWNALPAPGAKGSKEVGTRCLEMQAYVVRIRKHTGMQFAAPRVKGLPPGSQPLLHWKNREFAEHRLQFDPESLRNAGEPAPILPEIPKYPRLHDEAAPRWAALMAHARADDPDLVVPAARRKEYEEAFARFAAVFPDHFLVTERGRYFPDDSQDKGRLLSAGYHSVLGFFRDDRPLVELILNDPARRELDQLWLEFDYVADHTARTWVQYFFNQSGEVQGKGAESGTARPVGKSIIDETVVLAMRDAYLAKAAADAKNDPVAPRAIQEHYDEINGSLRNLERLRSLAPPHHLKSLREFAARAYRRPLTEAEGADLDAHYRNLREKNQLSHEDAMRESVVSVLMSPDFLYRIDLRSDSAAPVRSTRAFAAQPLAPYALASRLSYFLWSSMPDEALLAKAASGALRNPQVLAAETRRMLRDPRVKGLATEFTGNWLGFRQFETNNAVDRERFPTFTNELRTAMFEEPVRYFEDAVRTNRPVLDLLYGKYTFVNPVLAKHYGLDVPEGSGDTWARAENAAQVGRGGFLPMAVFLTQNSPGLRTSPVKRGNWVVQKLLGEVVPPPPPVVPELPNDESTSELPVREMLAKHRENALCSACHARIDSFGLPFEGYGPVGNRRETDLAGRPVDTLVTYSNGMKAEGVDGLREYIRAKRQQDFVANLSRKLLAYALNRSLQLSDEPLVEQMQARAAAGGFRFRTLIEAIVTSPQFLTQRAEQAPAAPESATPTRKARP